MSSNKSLGLANIRMLEFVATKLGELCHKLVFLGGCTTALFITDLNAPDIRYTLDVDCIVDVISVDQYHQLERQLSKKGFKKSLTEEVICRWFYDDVILDIMPTEEKILGFSNPWYKGAIQSAFTYFLTNEIRIKVVTVPYFLATKLEAFRNRGKMDFYASHDFEDIMSVLDGRIEIVNEILQSNKKLRSYLIKFLIDINKNPSFHGAVPSHFIQYGNLAENRIELLLQKIKAIISQG